MTRRTWLRVLGLTGLATAVASRAEAQQSVRPGPVGRLDGVRRRGNVIEFETATGAVAPVRLGIYAQGMVEPNTPADSGAAWIYVYGTPAETRVQLKVNLSGNEVVLGECTKVFPQ